MMISLCHISQGQGIINDLMLVYVASFQLCRITTFAIDISVEIEEIRFCLFHLKTPIFS